MRKLVSAVLVLYASAGPRWAKAYDARADIQRLLEAQVTAWNRADIVGFMEGYWKSSETEFVSSSGVLRGWNSVLQRYRKAYPDARAMGQLTFSDLEITTLCPEAALVTGNWRLRREHDEAGGVFTLTVRRFAGGWRIVNDHTSKFDGR